ncbi:MAG: hypothetical protein ACRDGJ_01950 [Candidatus Limnocylindria bacterium]
MVHRVLLVGAAVWSIVGVGGLGLGTMGAGWLHALLPPVVIDAAALGGGVTAMGASILGIGLAHAAVLAGLRRDQRWARSAALLLAATLAVGLLALAAAAATSAVTFPELAPGLLAGAAVAVIGAGAYAACLAWLMRRIGPGRAA